MQALNSCIRLNMTYMDKIDISRGCNKKPEVLLPGPSPSEIIPLWSLFGSTDSLETCQWTTYAEASINVAFSHLSRSSKPQESSMFITTQVGWFQRMRPATSSSMQHFYHVFRTMQFLQTKIKGPNREMLKY